MKKTAKPIAKRPTYFSESRDYARVVEAEASFFSDLVKAKNSIPCISKNPSLQKALHDLAPFLIDPTRSLSIIVKFSVTDPRSRASHTLMLGTQLQPPQPKSHAQVTHFLCLADVDCFLAKIHADFDFEPESKERKPSPHVQIGGGISQSLLRSHPNEKPGWRWDEGMSKPRIPSLPFSTALFWHWAFLEYREDEEIAAFLSSCQWRQLIRKAEAAVLQPYFEDALGLIKDHPHSGLLDALYIPLTK